MSSTAILPATSTDFASWLEPVLVDGTLPKGRALVLGGDMIEEVTNLLARGYAVRVVEARGEILGRLGREVRRGDIQTIHEDFLSMKPGTAGAVDLVVERTLFPSLEPLRRADWAHKVGRMLPPGCHLAGLFTVGVDTGAIPRAVTEDILQKLLCRHFNTVSMTPVGPKVPGRPRPTRGVFRRK